MSAAGDDAAVAPRLCVLVIKENDPEERRVALVPDASRALAAAGMDLLVEPGAGASAWFPDDDYTAAGARVLARTEALREADVVVTVGAPAGELVPALRPGQAIVGMLRPLEDPALAKDLAERGVTAISLDGLPRRLTRAQPMDALTSQASVAGYKAALVAADSFDGFFPLMITAAGTARPAQVLVLGAGVAGLQAMATARRLGAVVTGYDVRPETREEIESVGARLLALAGVSDGSTESGYARVLSEEEQASQRRQLDEQIARFDVVITTAQVPGRRPPVLVSARALSLMKPGSVVVDLAAGELGGNVDGSEPGRTVRTENGVSLIGAGRLPSRVPTAASAAYSRNVTALLASLVRDGRLAIDTSDEIQAGVVVTHEGRVVHPAVARLVSEPVTSDTMGGVVEP